MGNRTYLRFEDVSEFEANNCIPITWLSLFDPSDFVVKEVKELDDEEGETYTVAGYQTSPESALLRVNDIIEKLKGKTPAWFFLRPIELLQKEVEHYLDCSTISLDLTELYHYHDERYQQISKQAVYDFLSMIDQFDGRLSDVNLLTELTNQFSLDQIKSLDDLSPLDKTFLLIGTYYGDEEREEKYYNISYFEETYWIPE